MCPDRDITQEFLHAGIFVCSGYTQIYILIKTNSAATTRTFKLTSVLVLEL